jgi:hypothetical protein
MVQFGPADYSAMRLGVAPRVEIDTPDQARPSSYFPAQK